MSYRTNTPELFEGRHYGESEQCVALVKFASHAPHTSAWRKGAAVIAQNKETCVVFGMPAVAVAEGLADEVLPLEEIASHIVARVGRRTSP